jgi:hypothetical protein
MGFSSGKDGVGNECVQSLQNCQLGRPRRKCKDNHREMGCGVIGGWNWLRIMFNIMPWDWGSLRFGFC